MPSDIWTPMAVAIRHGATAESSVVAAGPAVARPVPGRVVLAEAMAAMTRAVTPARATGRR